MTSSPTGPSVGGRERRTSRVSPRHFNSNSAPRSGAESDRAALRPEGHLASAARTAPRPSPLDERQRLLALDLRRSRALHVSTLGPSGRYMWRCTSQRAYICVRVNLTRPQVHARILGMTNTRRILRTGRQLILIDIENITATPSPTAEEVITAMASVRRVVPGFDASQRIVACSHRAAPTVAFAFPRARHLWRSGLDGADRALLDVLENEDVDERFERVTICSGDGIFASVTARLGGADVDVTVVSLRGYLAARLELAARRVTLLAPALSTAANRSAH